MATIIRGSVLLVVALFCCAAEANNLTVETNAGTFIGKTQTVINRNENILVSNFLGIRFAEPPVGNRRFQNPVPKVPFREPQVVQEYGSRCAGLMSNVNGSEDCLFLNVFVPEKTSTEVLAVMVFLHGGSFATGSSSEYDANVLAALGHVIVVTVNYRVTIWGFLSTGDSNAPGNYGLWDQRLAIKWASDNIEAFGGDRSRITVFGESAGAASAIYQALYPPNEGLFKRFISQSGSVTAFWAVTKDHVNEAKLIASSLGCNKTGASEMMDCLRGLPFKTMQTELNNASSPLAMDIINMFKPVVDRVFVKSPPSDIFNMQINREDVSAPRNTFTSFDYLTGINSGEGAYLITASVPNAETFLPNKTVFDKVTVPSFVRDFLRGLTNVSQQIITETLIAEYTDWSDPENSVKIRDNIMQLYSDYAFFIPQAHVVNLHSTLSQKKTYMYYLDFLITQHVLSSTPSWSKKPNHADDLGFLFPPSGYFSSNVFPESDRIVAEQMITMWSNFAKVGDPNSPQDLGLSWPPYKAPRHSYLQITRNSTSANVKSWLFTDKVNLWTRVIPAISAKKDAACDGRDNTSAAPAIRTAVWIVLVSFVGTSFSH